MWKDWKLTMFFLPRAWKMLAKCYLKRFWWSIQLHRWSIKGLKKKKVFIRWREKSQTGNVKANLSLRRHSKVGGDIIAFHLTVNGHCIFFNGIIWKYVYVILKEWHIAISRDNTFSQCIRVLGDFTLERNMCLIYLSKV